VVLREGEIVELTRILFLIMIIPIALAGLALGGGLQAGQALIVTKDDNGKEIAVSEGAVFEVRLQQHGGTGYLWQIVALDEEHLKVLESTETPLEKGPIAGGPLLKTWKIEALKAGQTDLKILLYRPWEGPEKAPERFQIKVQIGQ
jgi:predicted secreted protein